KPVPTILTLCALLRCLQRVDRTRRAFLGQLIGIGFTVVTVGLFLRPHINIHRVRQYGENREIVIALRTMDQITLYSCHNRISPGKKFKDCSVMALPDAFGSLQGASSKGGSIHDGARSD